MLNIKFLKNLEQRHEILEQFDPRKATWVVPDLRSRWELQNRLLQRDGVVEEESILRSSELWRRLMTRAYPEFRYISWELVRTMTRDFLRKNAEPWAQTPGAPDTVLAFVNEFLTVYSHEDGVAHLTDWFKTHEDSFDRWGRWFLEGLKVWLYFLDKKILFAGWAGSILFSASEVSQLWDREIVLDMGPHLRPWEADLIRLLSKERDVTVLIPWPSFAQKGDDSWLPYRSFLDGFSQKELEIPSESGIGHRQFRRFTSAVAEVKDAVAATRRWLEEGVRPSEIGILSPDIGKYWSVLRPHLREEGIPVQRGESFSIQTFPEISRWLSFLSVKSGRIQTENLEASLFESSRFPAISWDDFVSLFGNIYGYEDLGRSLKVRDIFVTDSVAARERLNRDLFIPWALSKWTAGTKTERLEKLLKTLIQECPENLDLEVADWVELLFSLAAKTEEEVLCGNPEGIHCLDLTSAENVPLKKMVIMDLTEGALRRTGRVTLGRSEVESIHAETGFLIPFPDHSVREFEVRWLLESGCEETHLTVGAASFQGGLQVPSALWLVKAVEAKQYQEEPSLPETCRLDSILEASSEDIFSLRGREEILQDIRPRLREDCGIDAPGKQEFSENFRLSASSVESFKKCPFIFSATRLFGLADPEILDLDIDYRTQGNVYHRVLELLLERTENLNFSREDVESLVEKRILNEIPLADPRMKLALLHRAVETGTQFLSFEKEWRQKFSLTKTVGREVVFSGFVNPKTGEISRDQKDGIKISGKIDRVDTDGDGHYVLIDYKSGTKTKNKNFGAWIENGSIQLPLYAMVLESGLLEPEIPRGIVVGAIYFALKDWDRRVGLLLPEGHGVLFEIAGRSSAVCSPEAKKEIIEKSREMIVGVIKDVQDGRLYPEPFDKQNCQECRWKRICRAPHL